MLSVELFGRSHEESIGVTVTGFPAGEPVDIGQLQSFMARRAPKHRAESDIPVIKSGICDGVTNGKPLTIVIYNEDARPQDYEALKYIPRPGHADYPVYVKYNGREDMRGGGKYSGRMTAPLCAAGGIAKQILERRGISVQAEMENPGLDIPEGDSAGGIIKCTVTGMPIGIGDALFEGLDGAIARYVFAIPAVKGIEFGAGFKAAEMLGSENNDGYEVANNKVNIISNNAGGILGGMSTGEEIVFRVAFKPTPSISKPQKSVNLLTMENVELIIEGRHDKCIAYRAAPVVEAACALAILDRIPDKCESLNDLRNTVDIIDNQISSLLSERFAVTDRIALFKNRVYDSDREADVLANVSKGKYASEISEIYKKIMMQSKRSQLSKTAFLDRNIFLIGMPGCGKTTVGRILSSGLNRDFYDLDEEIEKRTGRSPECILRTDGEEIFRRIESDVLEELSALSGKVISCGGGVVTVSENRRIMKRNALVIWIQRSEELLTTSGRPLSQDIGIRELYRSREPLYTESADYTFLNDSTPEDCAERILNALTDN